MFSRGGSDNYFGVPDLDPNGGMLLDEEEEAESMDIDSDNDYDNLMDAMNEDALGTGGDEIKNLDILIFPSSKAALEYNNQGQYRLLVTSIPFDFVSIPPEIMKALSHYDEEMSKQKATICAQLCMPGLVHASPLESLFSSVAVLPKGQKPPPGGINRAWHKKYTSFQHSIYQLKMLFISVTGGLIPFKEGTFSDEDMQKVMNEFEHQTRVMEMLQNDRLDTIYNTAVVVGTDPNHIMQEFISLLEKYSYQMIHLYEYLIWTVAVAPRCDLPLEAILTPMELPVLSALTSAEQNRAKRDVNEFFNFKLNMRISQEKENASKGEENTDVQPREMLTQNSATQPSNAKYKELIPLRTLYEYLFFLDTDGILTKNNWHWNGGK